MSATLAEVIRKAIPEIPQVWQRTNKMRGDGRYYEIGYNADGTDEGITILVAITDPNKIGRTVEREQRRLSAKIIAAAVAEHLASPAVVERVARALCALEHWGETDIFDALPRDAEEAKSMRDEPFNITTQEEYLIAARAALAAAVGGEARDG